MITRVWHGRDSCDRGMPNPDGSVATVAFESYRWMSMQLAGDIQGALDPVAGTVRANNGVIEDERGPMHAANDMLSECARILKRDGLMILSVHIHEHKAESMSLPMLRVLVDGSLFRFVDSIYSDTVDAIVNRDKGTSVFHCILGKK